jgi:signal transduction histidine kinase
MASIEVIKRALKLQPPHESVHDIVQESIESGQRGLKAVIDLTADLLDTKKLQIGQRELEYQPISLELLFDEVSKTLQGLALQRRIMMRYHVSPRVLSVPGDTHLVRRMMINLAANALRFTPEGGAVTLNAYETSGGKSVMITVEDTGPGVDQTDRERIFQPYVQGGGEEQRGTGLGLAICREVALAHDGSIWVESRTGGGSRFCVMLPSSKAKS